MSVIQNAYTERHEQFQAGQITDTQNADIASYVVEGSSNIKFGYAVQQGSGSKICKAGGSSGNFIGIAVRDATLNPDQNDEYVKGDVCSVLQRGSIAVPVESPVSVGDAVIVSFDTGQMSAAAGGSVERVSIDTAGSGYGSTAPTVTFSAAPSGGTTATGTAVLTSDGDSVSHVTITEAGAGYTTAPTITVGAVSGATAATMTAVLQVGDGIDGARFMTTAASGDQLAVVRLSGQI